MNYSFIRKLTNLANYFENERYESYFNSTMECLIGYLDGTYCEDYVKEFLEEAYELKKDLKKLG